MDFTNARFLIDIDGFPIGGTIYFKELAIYDLHRNKVTLLHVKLPNSLISKEKTREVTFCEKNIHGLPFKNVATDLSYSAVINKIKDFDTNKQFTWLYKGGIVEKKLLNLLGFNSFNIEVIGCPKVEKIIETLNLHNLKNCSRHTVFVSKSRTCHCSDVEVRAFARWFQKYQENNCR